MTIKKLRVTLISSPVENKVYQFSTISQKTKNNIIDVLLQRFSQPSFHK